MTAVATASPGLDLDRSDMDSSRGGGYSPVSNHSQYSTYSREVKYIFNPLQERNELSQDNDEYADYSHIVSKSKDKSSTGHYMAYTPHSASHTPLGSTTGSIGGGHHTPLGGRSSGGGGGPLSLTPCNMSGISLTSNPNSRRESGIISPRDDSININQSNHPSRTNSVISNQSRDNSNRGPMSPFANEAIYSSTNNHSHSRLSQQRLSAHLEQQQQQQQISPRDANGNCCPISPSSMSAASINISSPHPYNYNNNSNSNSTKHPFLSPRNSTTSSRASGRSGVFTPNSGPPSYSQISIQGTASAYGNNMNNTNNTNHHHNYGTPQTQPQHQQQSHNPLNHQQQQPHHNQHNHPPYPQPPNYYKRKTWSPPVLKLTSQNARVCHSNDSLIDHYLSDTAATTASVKAAQRSRSDDLDSTPPRLAPISGVLAWKPGPNVIRPIAFKPISANNHNMSPHSSRHPSGDDHHMTSSTSANPLSHDLPRPQAVKLGTGMLGQHHHHHNHNHHNRISPDKSSPAGVVGQGTGIGRTSRVVAHPHPIHQTPAGTGNNTATNKPNNQHPASYHNAPTTSSQTQSHQESTNNLSQSQSQPLSQHTPVVPLGGFRTITINTNTNSNSSQHHPNNTPATNPHLLHSNNNNINPSHNLSSANNSTSFHPHHQHNNSSSSLSSSYSLHSHHSNHHQQQHHNNQHHPTNSNSSFNNSNISTHNASSLLAASSSSNNSSSHHNTSATSSSRLSCAEDSFLGEFTPRPSDRADSVPISTTAANNNNISNNNSSNNSSSRVWHNAGEGVLQTPSPSDSGVGELEAILREKDAEINTLREVMDRNERAILQVYEERKNAWALDTQDLKEEYERKLKIQSRKSYKTEQVLSLQVYKLQQDQKAMSGEKDNIVEDRDSLKTQLEQANSEISNLRNQLELKAKIRESLALAESPDSNEELAIKNKEVINLHTQLHSYQIDVDKKNKELGEKAKELIGCKEEVEKLKLELGRLRNPPLVCEVSSQTSHALSEVSALENVKPSLMGERERTIQTLQEELNELRTQVLEVDDRHVREKEQWQEEKNKVIRYQKQLQLNYVQMQRKNSTLETEVQQLTLDLENRDMKLIALSGEESVC